MRKVNICHKFSNIRIWYGHKTIKFISISFYCMVGITRHFSDVYSIFYRIDICWAISHSFFNFEELQKESYKDIGSYRSDNIYGNRIYNYFYGHNSCKSHPSWTCLLIDNRCIQYNILNIWYRKTIVLYLYLKILYWVSISFYSTICKPNRQSHIHRSWNILLWQNLPRFCQ